MVIYVKDKFGDLDRHTPVGNPYHGTLKGGELTLETTGEKVPWEQTSGRGINLIRLPFLSDPVTPDDEIEQGLRYDKYVLLQDCTKYPSPVETIDLAWIYSPNKSVAWRLTPLSFHYDKAKLLVRCLTKSGNDDATVTVPYDRLLLDEDFDTTMGALNYVSFSPDSTKMLVVFCTSGGFEYKSSDGSRAVFIVEFVATDGETDDLAPIITAKVLRVPDSRTWYSGDEYERSESTTHNDSPDTPVRYTDFLERSNGGYPSYLHFKRTWHPWEASHHDETRGRIRIVLMATYDLTGNLVIFEATHEYVMVDSGSSSFGGGTADLLRTRETANSPEVVVDTPIVATMSRTVNDYTVDNYSIGIVGGPQYHFSRTSTKAGSSSDTSTVSAEDLYNIGIPLGESEGTGLYPLSFSLSSPSEITKYDGYPVGSEIIVQALSNSCVGLLARLDDDSVVLVALVSQFGVEIPPSPVIWTDKNKRIAYAHPLTGAITYGAGTGFV